jgi:hypothetical protein
MKKAINTLGLSILLTSTSMISECSPQSLEVGESKPSTSTPDVQMPKAPNNAKEIESFADPLFEGKMKEYNVTIYSIRWAP